MADWQLAIDGGESRSLADWGITNVRRALVSQGMDIVTFAADGKAFDANEDFPYGTQLSIFKDGVRWFAGTVTKVPRQASRSSESLTYEVSGPWYWLDQIMFKLVWQFRSQNGGGIITVPLPSTHLILNVLSGVVVSTGTMITAALAYAIFRGAPMQIGVISPSLVPPLDEVRDITCAEVIRKMLRWHPNCVTWFDYSTMPYPTFHCRSDGELVVRPLAIPPERDRPIATPFPTVYDINPLYDWQRPSVCINYERKNTIDGKEYIQMLQDIAPVGATGNEIGALTATVDLMGQKSTTVTADLETVAVPDGGTDADKLQWLLNHCEEMQDPKIKDLKITDFKRQAISNNYPNELTGGQIADWMPFLSEDDVVLVTATYNVYDGGQQLLGQTKLFKIKFKATTAQSGTYSTSGVEDYGDPIPVGVAAYLYNQVKDLKYGGSFSLEEEELRVPPAVGMGNVVSLGVSPFRPEWLTMNALVQQVSEELDTGRTTITFGPPQHLGVADLIELTRINRTRRRETPRDAIQSGQNQGLNQLELGKRTPNNVTGAGDGDMSYLVVRGTTKIITLAGASGLLSILDTAAPGQGR
jgi:hypothetical protein